MELNDRQRRFVEEYLLDLNATQAAIRAGYSKRTANEQGARLLAKDSIKQAIQGGRAARSQRTELTSDYVLGNLTQIVERCMQRAPVLDPSGEQVQDEGRHVWQFKAKEAIGALALLGKHLGIFIERLEHSGPDGGPIEHRLTPDQRRAELAGIIAALRERAGARPRANTAVRKS